MSCDSLDVRPDQATLIATVATPEDDQRLAAAFDVTAVGPSGATGVGSGAWRLRQPQITADPSAGAMGVRITITLDRADSPAAEGPP